MKKNVAGQYLYLYAVNKTTLAAVTGDAANITVITFKDAGASGGTNDANPTEVAGGAYRLTLTQAETNGDLVGFIPTSVTADVVLDPVFIYTNRDYNPEVDVCETGETYQVSQQASRAGAAGKLSGAATTTVAIRDAADTKDRISATVDGDGNRSAVTVSGN